MFKTNRTRSKKGFTLIELLVVIVIMAILAAGTFLLFRTGEDEAAEAQTQKVIQGMANLVELYKAKYGNYPMVASDTMDFSVTIKDAACSKCGAKLNDTSATFGLASNFVGKGSMLVSSCEDSRIERFNDEINSDDDERSGWKVAFASWIGEDDPIRACAASEQSSEMNDIKAMWNQLLKEGVVEEGAYGCPERNCRIKTYRASAKPDGWGRALKYTTSGGGYEIISAGPDGQFGTSDDITSQGGSAKTNTKKSDDGMYN
jgi:prepilin-type N-terminal cleavage/methylation domain-containing protein